jgi:alpha-beta hydrolase superfamily lysophospholipase
MLQRKILSIILCITIAHKSIQAQDDVGMIFSQYSHFAIPMLVTLGFGSYMYHWSHTPAEAPTAEQLDYTCINEDKNEEHIILFAHGIDPDPRAYITQAASYAHILNYPALTFSFNDALKRINFAQQTDLDCLERAYNCVVNNYSDKKIVLIGVSRGAATALKFLAERQRTNITCVILESPWDTIQNLTKHISNQYLTYLPGSAYMLNALAHSLPNVQSHQSEVIDAVNQLQTNIPIHIIYSTADKVVPPDGTANIIEALQKNNPNVTCICLLNGKHGKLSYIDECIHSVKRFMYRHLN